MLSYYTDAGTAFMGGEGAKDLVKVIACDAVKYIRREKTSCSLVSGAS